MNLINEAGNALGSLGSLIGASGFKPVDVVILIVYI